METVLPSPAIVSKRWTDEHSSLLIQALEEQHLDPSVVAHINAVSMHQLRELEAGNGRSRFFYTEELKWTVGMKLLRWLGVSYEPPVGIEEPTAAPPLSETVAPPTDKKASRSRTLAAVTMLAMVGVAVAMLAATLAYHWWPAINWNEWPRFASLAGPTAPRLDAPRQNAAAPQTLPEAKAEESAVPVATDSEKDEPDLCSFTGPGFGFSPATPSKSFNYVFVIAKNAIKVCFKDASGNTAPQALPAGSKAKLSGQPPFQLAVDEPSNAQIFFGGELVRMKPVSGFVILGGAKAD